MDRWLRPFLTLLLLAINAIASGQQLPLYRFTVRDGLPHSDVYRIMQDRQGFLWFSTDRGISIYDGRQFKNFQTTDGLSAHTVMSAAQAPDGSMWVSTYGGGINLMSARKFRRQRPGAGVLPDYVIFSMPDATGAWVITRNPGIFRLECDSAGQYKVRSVHHQNIFFRKMVATKDGVWFLSRQGLYLALKNDTVPRPFMPDQFSGNLRGIAEGAGDSLLLAAGNNIYQVKPGIAKRVMHCPGAGDLSDMLRDRKGRIWIATIKGLLTIQENRIDTMTRKAGLEQLIINDLFQDRQGNIWIATHGSGLYCIHSFNIINYPVEEGTISNHVKAIAIAKGRVYAGSRGTVAMLENEKFRPVKLDQLGADDFIYQLGDLGRHLFVATPRGCLLQDPQGKERIIAANEAITVHTINGLTWIGGYSAAGIYRNGRYQKLDTASGLHGKRINSICSEPSNTIYFGTSDGLFAYDGKYREIDFQATGLARRINRVISDRLGRLWIATDSGLYRRSMNTVHLFPGLPAHEKYTALATDEQGAIWVGTANGLYRITETGTRRFDITSGLISNEILSLCIDRPGSLWVGTVNGISHMSTNETAALMGAPDIYITSVHTGDSRQLFPRHVTLPWKTQGLTVSFAAPDFPYADRIEYQYRIPGVINRWQYASAASVDLTPLPGGKHLFEVRARKNGGSWGPPALLQINVQIPFWRTPWFYIAATVVVLLSSAALIRMLILRKALVQKKKVDIESRMLHLRHQALSAMINPHFLFNCLNTIQAYIQNNDRDAARTGLAQFSKLIRSTLEHSQEIDIPLNEEIRRLRLYLEMEQLRFGTRLHYTLECQVPAPEGITIPNMIIQPYVENAILHGIMPRKQGGSVSVAFRMLGSDSILTEIRDTGIGLSRSKDERGRTERSSMGMKLIGDRLMLLEKMTGRKHSVSVTEVLLPNGTAGGTLVQLIFPIGRNQTQFSGQVPDKNNQLA